MTYVIMSSSASPLASSALAVGRSSPNDRPLLPSPSTAGASAEYAGALARAAAPCNSLSLKSSSQLIITQQPERPLRARPPTPPSVAQDPRAGGTAVADEQTQRTELLALIARLSRSLMPATERLIRLRSALRALQEQLVVTIPPAAVVTATGGASAGASISSVSMSDTSVSPRLCVAGTSYPDMEAVLYFLAHRDPPLQRCGTCSGAVGGASGGRPPTPCTGMLVSPHASPSSSVPRRWSRLESGAGGAGTNAMASSTATGVSASGLWQTSAIGFGDASCPSSPSAPSFRFPSTPPLAPTLMPVTHATVHDSASLSGASNRHSPVMTDSPSLDQLTLPTMHARVACGVHHGSMQVSRDNATIPPHLLQTTPPLPLPATVPATGTTTTMSAASTGAAAVCADGGSVAGRLLAAPTAHNLHPHRTLSPYPPPSSVASGSPQVATPPPPLPAAPANHHVRRVRSTTSLELHTSGGSPSGAVTKDAEAPSYESRTQPPSQMVPRDATSPVEVASEGGDGSMSAGSMSLSSTMPDLPATPPPPLPGFTTLEVSGASWRTSSPQPATSTVVSLPSPTLQGIVLPGADNYAAGAPNGALVASFRSRTGSRHACAGAFPSPAGESPAPPTPIMINSLPRTSSQSTEVSEQLHRYRQSLLGSSLPPGTARFTTLPTPFMSRVGAGMQSSGARSLREDSAVLSRASSFTPPAMRFVQRVRRRMLTLSQMQLQLSAWDLFHTDHIGGRSQAALQVTAAASVVTSPAVSLTSAAQGGWRAKNEPESRGSSSESKSSNSRYQEYSQHSCGVHAMSEMPQQVLLGPHWLLSVSEDGFLRYEPLPSAAQPPPYMQSPPVATTADFAFLCVPYEALARVIGAEVGHHSHISTSGPFGVSAGGVGVTVSGDGALEEVAAVLDVLFGLFSGSRQQHSPAHQQRRPPHRGATGAKSSLLTVNNGGGGATISTAHIHSSSPPVQEGEEPLPQPMVCAGGDNDGQRTWRDKRHAEACSNSYPQATARPIIDTAGGRGGHGDAMTSPEVHSPEASSPRMRVSKARMSTAADFPLFISKRMQPAGCLDNDISLLPHHSHVVPGLPASLTEDWLLPLRQVLVDRTIFLLVKPDSEEAPASSLRRANARCSAEDSDGAMNERVVQRFLWFAKTRYGVTVQPWRVITFSYRDATRARNVMLAVYGQRLRRKQQQHGQSANWRPTSETLSQAHPTSGAGEDDMGGNATPADGADVRVASTASPVPRSGCSVSPLESSCVTAGLPAIPTPGGAQTPPGASLMSTSRLTLTSLVGGSEWRRGRNDGASRPHDDEGGQQELSDAFYTLLTQDLSVQPLSTALEEYRPLLECHAATQMSAQYGASAGAALTSPAAGICSQASCAGGMGPATSAIDEGEQARVDAARRLSGAAGSVPAIEGPATGDVSDEGVDAAAAAACKHAQEVVWRASGAAGVSSALRYFQHAAVAHRVGRAALPVMMWSWQLYSLLPVVIKDAQSRRNRLRHNSRHCQHKLKGVQRSITLHLDASPAKNVAALEVRLQAGFKEMAQRFLRDLRRLFISTASAATTAAFSPVSKVSAPSWSATGAPGHGQRQQQTLPFAPLDALLVYDSPGLREAYQRLARAALRFHAFYLAGYFAFDVRMPSQPSRTGYDAALERKLSQSPRPISVYEQRYAALREAVCLSQLQLRTPLRMLNDLNVAPPDESCTRPGTSSPAVLLPPPPPTRAVNPATKTPTTSAVRLTPSGSAARTPTTTKSEAEETPMPKVELRPNSRRRCSSRITSAAGSAASLVKESSPLRPVRRREPSAAPPRVSVEGGSDERLSQRSFLSPSFLASAAREVVAAAASSSVASTELTATKNGMDPVSGVPGQERGTRGMSSEPAADERADGDGTPRLSLEELQQRRVAMEHQLIAHVSQINTEIINFLLATCVAAVPQLQRDCVGAELARVKDAQAEIVSSFTTAVRGRKDAAIAMSHLYARLEEWSAEMSHLVSVVRSRPYLEKFITQLRAVLCEDQVRALAVFRCDSGDGQDSGAAAWQTPQVDDTSPSPSSAATKAHRGIYATAVRLPLTSTRASASASGGLRDSTLKGSAEQHAAAPSPSGTPCACASKSLAAEVGYRSARMLRYYTRLACKRRGSSGSDKLSDTSMAANAQRSGVFGEMLASPSPSRSLRSIQGVNSTLTSPHCSSRMKGGGGGGHGALGLSVSLSSMSAAWSREEACLRVEGGARTLRVYDADDAKAAAFAFFASPTQPVISAVAAEVLAMLEVMRREPLRSPLSPSAPQAVVGAESRGAARDGAASPATPAAAPAHRSVDADGSAWQKRLTQWRSAMADAERPADDASAAPLLWIVLDTWDETLLRMPYGLLLQLDTPSYAESLNRMSDELLNTQESWKSNCEDVLARIQRQLHALEVDLNKICDDRGEARAEYVRELRAVFDAASVLIASRDDPAMSACPFCELPGSTRAGLRA
ncbi:hypothetical protein conserved [Leishmania donovani]|nr:hypothetical protein conserved [Leishmania donovani]